MSSQELIAAVDRLPSNEGRASRVHALIEATGLLDSLDIVVPRAARADEIAKYHDRGFVDHLLGRVKYASEDEEYEMDRQYSIVHDCPYFDGLKDYVELVAGASLAAANHVLDAADGEQRVGINWTGGRHHARRARCSGFCYINDVVLTIQQLRTRWRRVLYVDLDVHHGDGVEQAFARSSDVLCASIHRFGKDVFPQTGSASQIGSGAGAGFTINVPTRSGLSDGAFLELFEGVIVPTIKSFRPEAIVVVCGTDGLARDPHAMWNLSLGALDKAVSRLLNAGLPTVLLGGGGYNHADTARCWSLLTAAAIGLRERLSWRNVPDHEYYAEYAQDATPEFFFEPSLFVKDLNTKEQIEKTVAFFERIAAQRRS